VGERVGPPADVLAEIEAHVEAILARGGIPAGDRRDVGEELTGHLIERWQDAVAGGTPADRAVARAILDFGGGDTIGPAFVRAYHSALWASTIGTLLPIAAATNRPPGSIRWAILFDRVMAVFSVLAGAVLLATWSPVRALAAGALVVAGGLVLWLAAEALQRGQRWGHAATLFCLVVNVVILFASFFPPNGGINLSLNGLAGLIILVALLGNAGVEGWLRGSATLPARIGAVVAAVLLGWALAPYVGDRLPDPTQIGPNDVSVVASMTCATSVEQADSEGIAEIVVDVTPRRVDAWPLGFLKDGDAWGDAIEVRFADESTFVNPGRVTDLATGAELIDSWGERVHPGLDRNRLATGILGSEMTAGRTIRVTIPAYGQSLFEVGVEPIPIEARVAYGHIDRFLLVGNLECGGRTPLHERGVAD
jgi:hypothetical protein